MIRHMPLLLMMAGATMAMAQGAKPKVPPGLDPGGMAVGLMTTGIDYTRPEVARHLARDGEGELIGRDLVDDDNRPYAAASPGAMPRDGDGTELVLRMAGAAPVRIVPLRIAPARPVTLTKAVAFAARTPARIVFIALPNDQPEHWQPLIEAAKQVPQVFVVAVRSSANGAPPDARQPIAETPANLLVAGVSGDAGAEVHVVLPEEGTKSVVRLAAGFLAGLGACAAATAPSSDGRGKLARLIANYRQAIPVPKVAGQITSQPCTLQASRS